MCVWEASVDLFSFFSNILIIIICTYSCIWLFCSSLTSCTGQEKTSAYDSWYEPLSCNRSMCSVNDVKNSTSYISSMTFPLRRSRVYNYIFSSTSFTISSWKRQTAVCHLHHLQIHPDTSFYKCTSMLLGKTIVKRWSHISFIFIRINLVHL